MILKSYFSYKTHISQINHSEYRNKPAHPMQPSIMQPLLLPLIQLAILFQSAERFFFHISVDQHFLISDTTHVPQICFFVQHKHYRIDVFLLQKHTLLLPHKLMPVLLFQVSCTYSTVGSRITFLSVLCWQLYIHHLRRSAFCFLCRSYNYAEESDPCFQHHETTPAFSFWECS